jgi:hypothetical protein
VAFDIPDWRAAQLVASVGSHDDEFLILASGQGRGRSAILAPPRGAKALAPDLPGAAPTRSLRPQTLNRPARGHRQSSALPLPEWHAAVRPSP